MLEITEVRVTPFKGESKIRAFANITLNNAFAVSGLKIIDGTKGLFVAMPSTKNKAGEYNDICFPINPEARKMITDAVLKEYNKAPKTKSSSDDLF